MHRSLRRPAAVVALSLAAAALVAPAAEAQGPDAPELYVATTAGGKLTQTHTPGVYRLKLIDPAQSVSAFTDHPVRGASTETLEQWVADWTQNGFAADPPNAALVLDHAPSSRDVYTFALSNPRLGRSGALTFRAQRIGAPSTGPLEQLGKRADRPTARGFGRASLFIDDSAPQTPIAVSVSGIPAGQVVVLNLDQELSLDAGQSFQPDITVQGSARVLLPGNAVIVGGSTGTLSGQLGLAVAGSDVSGTAQIPAGATVTISVNGGATHAIANGKFSIGG